MGMCNLTTNKAFNWLFVKLVSTQYKYHYFLVFNRCQFNYSYISQWKFFQYVLNLIYPLILFTDYKKVFGNFLFIKQMCQGNIARICQRIHCQALSGRKSTICEIWLGQKRFLLCDKQEPSVMPKIKYGC